MSETKDKLSDEGDLPIERVERVGDYFKNLFVRSLKLGLDDEALERPWEALAVPAKRPQPAKSIEAEAAANAGSGGASREKETFDLDQGCGFIRVDDATTRDAMTRQEADHGGTAEPEQDEELA